LGHFLSTGEGRVEAVVNSVPSHSALDLPFVQVKARVEEDLGDDCSVEIGTHWEDANMLSIGQSVQIPL
jgi:hypothetical protein